MPRGIARWMLATMLMSLQISARCQTGAVGTSASHETISGMVLDDRDSKPIEGAVVAVEVLGGPPVDADGGQTGTDGSFKIAALSGSQYRIFVQKQGFMTLSRTVSSSGSVPGAAGLDLGELRLVAQGTISGKVTDSEGKPLIGASVQLSRVNLEGLTTTLTAVATTTTNDLGEYRIFGLAPGTYYVSALFQDLADALGLRRRTDDKVTTQAETEDHAVTYYPGSPNVETARPIRLKAGVALPDIDIPLATAPSFSVRGAVTNLPPNPPPFKVRLQPLHAGSLGVSRGYTLSPGNSTFLFKSIPPGGYVVRVELQAAGHLLSARQEIVVGAGSIEGVILDLRTPFPIVGKVSMNGSANLPRDLQISLNAVDRQFRTPIKPRAEGQFQIEDAGPDRYSISASDGSGATYIKAVALDTQPVGATGISISDASHVLRIEVSDKAAGIQGIAIDGEQQPIAGGLAILMGPDTKDFHSQATVIGADGKFSFKSLAPGKYRISCFSDLKAPSDATWDVQKKVTEQGVEINLVEGDRQQISVAAGEADSQ